MFVYSFFEREIQEKCNAEGKNCLVTLPWNKYFLKFCVSPMCNDFYHT
jgi:hypothetical protein